MRFLCLLADAVADLEALIPLCAHVHIDRHIAYVRTHVRKVQKHECARIYKRSRSHARSHAHIHVPYLEKDGCCLCHMLQKVFQLTLQRRVALFNREDSCSECCTPTAATVTPSCRLLRGRCWKKLPCRYWRRLEDGWLRAALEQLLPVTSSSQNKLVTSLFKIKRICSMAE